MIRPKLEHIVQLNFLDGAGGAASVSGTLHAYFKREGYRSRRLVGVKLGSDPDTFELKSALRQAAKGLPAYERGARLFETVGPAVKRRLELRAGFEDLGPPAMRYIEDILPGAGTVVLCHNLHGGYFPLTALPGLSRRYPVVLLLHDPWLLAGHCAHPFDCEKWVTGCGGCPYPEVQYAIKRDTSHANWARKNEIYRASRLYVVTPSQWLMEKVERSILAPAVLKSCVINNGVDREIFSPGDREKARRELGIPLDRHVVMFAANGIRDSVWKDWPTMRAAVEAAAQAMAGRPLTFLAVGEEAPALELGAATVTFVPQRTPEELAGFYRAADLYLHAARAENFPCTVVEALSCGTPVVATAVGGIPEQVKGFAVPWDTSGLNRFAPGEATGILAPAGDAGALGAAIVSLLEDPGLREELSRSAAADAAERFSIRKTGAQYLDFFEEILADFQSGARSQTQRSRRSD